MAHVLSTIAGYKGDYRGRWLSAASLDKYLHRTGQLQIFGTQYFVAGDRRLNPSRLSDALRREFCVPSLAAQQANDATARAGGRTWTRITRGMAGKVQRGRSQHKVAINEKPNGSSNRKLASQSLRDWFPDLQVEAYLAMQRGKCLSFHQMDG